jgi:hypothetical protein
MNCKRSVIVFITCLVGWSAWSQERAIDLVAGAIYPIRTSDALQQATAKPGLTFGLLYRKKNEKGEIWSIGAEYKLIQLKSKVTLNNREETQTERFEIFHLRGCPLYWAVGKKKQVYIEGGACANYLLHSESELKSNLVNDTKTYQRLNFGLSAGLGWQLGESLRKSIIIGLRDDFDAIGFGKKSNGTKATALKFNTINLYIGLGL